MDSKGLKIELSCVHVVPLRTRTVPTNSEVVKKELADLRAIMASCYGPFGKALLQRPVRGGHVTVTSRSGSLFQLHRLTTPLVQSAVAALQEHVSSYHDNGLFAGLVCTDLVLHCLDLDLPMRRVSDVVAYILNSVAEYLESDRCPCKMALDWASAQQLTRLIRSLLSTKPVCGLDGAELSHIASMLLQSFVNVLPEQNSEIPSTLTLAQRVHIYTSVGGSVSNSALCGGVLVDSHFTQQLTRKEEESSSSLLVKKDKNGNILTAVFGISLSGKGDESDWLDGVQLEVDVSALKQVRGAELQELLALARDLVKMGVGFVGCQKCIHPMMREALESNEVIVAEQLSAYHIDSVRDVTGGKMINSASSQPDASWLGCLKDARIVTLVHKKYLLLEGFTSHSSLVLFCKSESAAEELKPLCSGILSCLERSLSRPHLLCGGGCNETVLAHYVAQKWGSGTVDIPEELLCDRRSFSVVVKEVVKVFSRVASSLEHHGGLVLTESAFHHCWSFPPYEWCLEMPDSSCFSTRKSCNCGSYCVSDLPVGTAWIPVSGTCATSDIVPERLSTLLLKFDTMCDPIEPKTAALRLAGEIASMILRTGTSLVTVTEQ